MSRSTTKKDSTQKSPVGLLDYALFLLLIILPPAGYAFSDWKVQSEEILLKLQNTQYTSESNRHVIFGRLTNTTDVSLKFKEGRYQNGSDSENTTRVSVRGLVTNLKPGETRKVGLILRSESFDDAYLQLIFTESDSVASDIQYSIESLSVEPIEQKCYEDSDKICYRLNLKAEMKNTGSEIIYNPRVMVRLWSDKGPAGIRTFDISTGEELNKWYPGKQLSVDITHEAKLLFLPVRHDYSLSFL